ncbi:uncharacterized protein LOC129240585 [Anastrepha obliqua]|uniref:uncharacterized protein LOC129240585 n=1 Tax=Anastrepha obliqua TaxID=95512 RepID=UPI0024099202|nr:uncharacterized protein LOC129240585 [Anastrepha obliqua]
MQCYAPTDPSDDASRDAFYCQLESVMTKIPTGDIRIVLGDFKSRIGNNNEGIQTIMGYHGLGSVRNGNACTSAAKSSLGFVKQQNKPWLRESTWQIVQKRRDIKNQLQSTDDPIRKVNLASRYKIADTEVKDKAAKDKERYYNEIASDAEKAAGVYVAINKLANVKPHIPPLKDIDGNTLTTEEKQLTECRRHYETRESVEEANPTGISRLSPHLARKLTPQSTSLKTTKLLARMILAFVILERIAPALNNILRTEQNGFRPKRSCVNHINTLRIIIEQSAEWRSPLYLLFVDFVRAFDTLSRRAIWSCLRTNGVPEKIVNIIQELYEGAVCSALFKGKKSELFSIHNGVRQCVTVLDAIISKTNIDIPSGIHWRPYQKLCDLDYADDICFLTHKLSEAHAKLTALARYASQVGLRANFKKAKLIRIETPNQDALTLEVGGTLVTIEDIENFCFLGSTVSKNGGSEADLQVNSVSLPLFKLNAINQDCQSK